MNILFLIYHGFSETSGITKKIKAQVDGLRQSGHKVYVCTYSILKNGHRCRMIDDEILQDFGSSKLAPMKKRVCYNAVYKFCIEKKVDAVYCRSFHNANPWTISLFSRLKKAGIKCVMEIPTYPYDQEYVGFPLFTRMELLVDKLFRKKLARKLERIVTFSSDKEIFGQKTICISNGISFEKIPVRVPAKKTDDTIHLIGVAEVHYWHAFDRVISGIGEYYKNNGKRNILFHIIGGVGDGEMHGSQHAPGFKELIDRYGISDHIIFHGAMYGDELNHYFDVSDFAIGSLGRHRSGITDIKTLKNREYAVRGIPFIYSEHDEDFEDKPYIIKAPADESPINMQCIIDYVEATSPKGCLQNEVGQEQGNGHKVMRPEEIRKTITHLSWKCQMERVIEEIS